MSGQMEATDEIHMLCDGILGVEFSRAIHMQSQEVYAKMLLNFFFLLQEDKLTVDS